MNGLQLLCIQEAVPVDCGLPVHLHLSEPSRLLFVYSSTQVRHTDLNKDGRHASTSLGKNVWDTSVLGQSLCGGDQGLRSRPHTLPSNR